MTPAPSPEAQLQFLAKLQRLFSEGEFNATYKFALLMALAELAVENGRDDGDSLSLPLKAIGHKFIDLYWQQTAPYSSAKGTVTAAVLVQNTGAQAAIISAIATFRRRHKGSSVRTAPEQTGFGDLLRAVTTTVRAQPITYLQNLGGQTDRFLYAVERGAIRLLPGVTYCLRRFQPLVTQLSRSHWVQHIKHNSRNHPMLGESDDLEGFLFETSRLTLKVIGAGLRKLSPKCFYCASTVHEADVDHFVPFAMYPRDLMHNFVLAHPVCNRSKSDTLAAKGHLERWRAYIDRHDDDLLQIGTEAGRTGDLQASLAVTRWGYGNALSSGAQAWEKASTYVPVASDYLEVLTP